MICDNCQHCRVCKHEDGMREFDSKIKKMLEQSEFKTFGAELKCEDFFDFKKYSAFKNEMLRKES